MNPSRRILSTAFGAMKLAEENRRPQPPMDLQGLAAFFEAQRRVAEAEAALDPFHLRRLANGAAALGGIGVSAGLGAMQQGGSSIPKRLLGLAGSSALSALGVVPGSRFRNRVVDRALENTDDVDAHVKSFVEAHRPSSPATAGAMAGAVMYGLGGATSYLAQADRRQQEVAAWNVPRRPSTAPESPVQPRDASFTAQIRYVNGVPTVSF